MVSTGFYGWFSGLLKKEEASLYCFAAPSHIEQKEDTMSFFLEVKENISDFSSAAAEIERIWSFLEEKLQENTQHDYAYRFLGEMDDSKREPSFGRAHKDLRIKKVSVLMSFKQVKQDDLNPNLLLLAYAVAASLWEIFPNLSPKECLFDLISEETLNSESSNPNGGKEAVRLFDFFEEVKRELESVEEEKKR